MQALQLSSSFMTFYSVSGFSPIMIHPVESPDTSFSCLDRKISEIVLETVPTGKLLILSREDLEEINYKPNKRIWTEEEDKKLIEFREERGMEWEDVSKMMPHRNPKMCYSRYKRILESNKKVWKAKDNQKLMQLVTELGQDWKVIQKQLKNWNARQIKEHYDYYLRPNLDGKAWTVEEDLQLIDFVNQHGKDWARSQSHFPNKSLSHIKNRFYGRLLKLNDKKLEKLGIPKEECSC